MSSTISDSGLELPSFPRRRRINSLLTIKNQLLEQLNFGLAKLRGSPLIRSQVTSPLVDADDLSSPSNLASNLVLRSDGINRTLNRFSIDPARRQQLIDNEIETLRREEAELVECLADIEALVEQSTKLEEELKEQEKRELEKRSAYFNELQQTMMEKIGQLNARKDKIDEHLSLTTRLRDCLKRQLKETCKRRDLLKENLYAHVKEIDKLNRSLLKETDKYQKGMAFMEESFKNNRLDDQTLLENYKMKERLITKELEERMVIRKSLEESKFLVNNSLSVDEADDDQSEENEEQEEESQVYEISESSEVGGEQEEQEETADEEQSEDQQEEVEESDTKVELEEKEDEEEVIEETGVAEGAEMVEEDEMVDQCDEEDDVFVDEDQEEEILIEEDIQKEEASVNGSDKESVKDEA